MVERELQTPEASGLDPQHARVRVELEAKELGSVLLHGVPSGHNAGGLEVVCHAVDGALRLVRVATHGHEVVDVERAQAPLGGERLPGRLVEDPGVGVLRVHQEPQPGVLDE
eukprot:15474123-Alexandrium_andersonii.AAC.1